MSYHNPFSDDPSFHEPPKSNTAAVVLIVLAVVGGSTLLMCGGMMAASVWMARQAQQDFEMSMEDFDNLEDFDGRAFQTDADLRRYYPLRNLGHYDEALAELDRALAEHPDDALLHNEKAWMLATCPVDEVRDGGLAVEHGEKACELTNWTRPEYVDTLAAAHAEAGDFEAAAQWQQNAIDLDPSNRYLLQFQDRLELYQDNTPYREGVVPNVGQ